MKKSPNLNKRSDFVYVVAMMGLVCYWRPYGMTKNSQLIYVTLHTLVIKKKKEYRNDKQKNRYQG
jgi:hypothetical protein